MIPVKISVKIDRQTSTKRESSVGCDAVISLAEASSWSHAIITLGVGGKQSISGLADADKTGTWY